MRNPDAGLNLQPMRPTNTAPQQRGARSSQTSPGTGVTPYTATAGGNIQGLGNSGYGPSDVSAAAGSSDIVEAVNESFAIYSKSGTQQYTSTLQNWFGTSASLSVFDPHVTFDPWGSRYVMVADDGTNWRLSVAQATPGTSTWCNYTLPAVTASGQFADYPEIGVDQRNIYLSMVDFQNGSQVDSVVEAVPRSKAESCSTVHTSWWTQVRDPGTACLLCSQDNLSFHVAPATTYDSLSTDGWLADAYPGGGSHITVFHIDTNNVLHAQQISTPSYTVPTSAAQPGTTAVLDTDEPDFTNITKIGGELYLALTSGYDWGNGNKNSTVNWMQINGNASNITLDKSGAFGNPGSWYFYPSTSGAPSPGQYQTFNYALSGSSIPVSSAVAQVNSSGTIVNNNYVLQGASNYTGTSVSGDNAQCSSTPCYRWGDYSSLLIDPTNSSVMWAAEADAPDSANWSTAITPITNS